MRELSNIFPFATGKISGVFLKIKPYKAVDGSGSIQVILSAKITLVSHLRLLFRICFGKLVVIISSSDLNLSAMRKNALAHVASEF